MRKLRIALGTTPIRPATSRPCRARAIASSRTLEAAAAAPPRREQPQPELPLSRRTGQAGRRASDRRAPLKRLALGFGSLLAALVLAVSPGTCPASCSRAADRRQPADHRGAAAGRHERRPERAGAVRRPHRGTVELAGAHPDAARGGAHLGVRVQGQEHRRARNRPAARAPPTCSKDRLRRSGNQLRITTQLIEASSGLHIWSKSFDLPLGDIFLIEDTVSRSVAEALHLELAADTAEQWAQRQPEKMEAYELYLLGRARQRKRTADDNLKAAEFFRRAIDADPQYALAHVGLAETLLNGLSLNRAPLEDVSARSRAADQPRARAQSEPARCARGEGLAADRGVPARRGAAAAAAGDRRQSERCRQPSHPRQSLRPARRPELRAEPLLRPRPASTRSISSRMCSAARSSSTSASSRMPKPPARGRASSIPATCGDRWPPPGSRARAAIPTQAIQLGGSGAQARARPMNISPTR